MSHLCRVFAVALCLTAVAALPAQDKPTPIVTDEKKADDGFRPLFNGKNLDGWVNVNCHPDTFFVKDGEIVTNGKPMGFLRTNRQYENFVLEMDWMHVNKTEVGNSGLFVWGDPLPATGTVYTRGIEVQVLVNLEYKNKDGKVTASSHGDLFSIWGATCVPDRPHPGGSMRCIPSEYRAKGGGEWNHYKVTANDGVIKLEVNGKEVSGVSKCNPRKGYLALESEGAECHFKNIRIKELPSTNPKPEEVAKQWEGHTSIFNGLDLMGWIVAEAPKKPQWKVGGGKLISEGERILRTTKKYGPFEMMFDWKLPGKDQENEPIAIRFSQGALPNFHTTGLLTMGHGNTPWKDEKLEKLKETIKPGAWARSVIRFDGTTVTISINGQQVYQATTEKPREEDWVAFFPRKGVEIMNVFVCELQEKK